MFADATGDHQWIHVDSARAAAGPFGGTIAHGYLTLSMVIPLFAELLKVTGISMGINYGVNKVRFTVPVPVGSRVLLHQTLKNVEDIEGGVRMTFDSQIEVEGSSRPALVAENIGLAFD
jgi:acyl dehydratase